MKHRDTLCLLTIGNSFSDDAMEYVYPIATNLGVKRVVLGTLYIGGCPLALHLKNIETDAPAYEYRTNTDGSWHTTLNTSMSTALREREWDIISFQQASPGSGVPESYDALPALIDSVRTIVGPRPELVWHMTWAYPAYNRIPVFLDYHNGDPLTMFRNIVRAVQARVLPSGAFTTLIPAGTAIQNARSSPLVGDTLNRDEVHLSLGLGRYIAGLTFVHALTGLPLDNLTYHPDSVSEIDMKIAIEAATKAVVFPFDITPPSYSEP